MHRNGVARLLYDVAVADSRYLRYPHVRGDLLAFVADDDVWLAPAAGGRAWRISADRAPAASPRLSPDGALVAWTSWRDGSPEIYLASTEGGAAERVSYWSNNATRLHGWSPAGELLASTAAGQPFGHYTWAYAIPVTDGQAQFARHRRLPFGPAANVAIDGDGTVALLTSSYQDPAFWKRYRGGTSGRLWVSTESGAEHRHRVPAAAGRPGRAVPQPDAGRRAARLPQRLRGHGQRLLVRAGRL